MSLDADDVKKIAYLARLKIDEDDIAGYVSSLSSILELVEQMSSVDTEGVLPMSHPMDAVQRLREDKVINGIISSKSRQKLKMAFTLCPR